MDAIHPQTGALIRKLETISPLTPGDRAALLRLPMTLRTVAADQDLLREGDTPSECCLIVEGFVCCYNVTAKGKRQILSFNIPGDIPDLQSLHLTVLDHNMATLTPSKLAFIQHDSLRRMLHGHPRLGELFWRDTLVHAAIFRKWMIGLGRRSAHGHLAHFLCEVVVRLKAVDLAEDDTIQLPLTQAELGDALGISTVHVNRVLQDLRGDNLISLRGTTLTVLDWDGLKKKGEFNPTYLHLSTRDDP